MERKKCAISDVLLNARLNSRASVLTALRPAVRSGGRIDAKQKASAIAEAFYRFIAGIITS